MRSGGRCIVVEARSDGEIEAAFATLVQRQAGALMVGVVPHFTYNSNKIVALAARHKIPAMYPFPIYAFRGGLMSYGADVLGMLRQVGRDYVVEDSQGRQTRRSTCAATDQIRACHQPQDREGARPRPCRRRCSPSPTR